MIPPRDRLLPALRYFRSVFGGWPERHAPVVFRLSGEDYQAGRFVGLTYSDHEVLAVVDTGEPLLDLVHYSKLEPDDR